MSLAAHVAVGSSWRVDAFGGAMMACGIVAVAVTLATRMPEATVAWLAAGLLAAILSALLAARRHRHADRHVVAVSNRLEVGLSSTSGAIDGRPCRLDRSSMVWPGFAVLALRDEDGGSIVRLPCLAADASAADRRSLHRYLLWALRTGAARPQSPPS